MHALAFTDPALGLILNRSTSQRGQDILAFLLTGRKPKGYFVEIGVGDGISNSNTLALEELGWEGLLIEPSKEWHGSLMESRRASKDFRAAYSTGAKQLEFLQDGELSGLKLHFAKDGHKRRGLSYFVETVTATASLLEHSSPRHIDFLSIDTEGSEIDVLRGIDFERYSFGFICVEHNYTHRRDEISELLRQAGYTMIMEELSMNDSYFVPSA